jgi:hypothetical protein
MKVGVYEDDPSQLHAMIKDFGVRMYDEDPDLLARLFPVYYKAHHAIAQFTLHLSLPDVRPGLTKRFQFENSAKPEVPFDVMGQFQDQDYGLGYKHRIDILVNRVRYKVMKFVMKFRMTHLRSNQLN